MQVRDALAADALCAEAWYVRAATGGPSDFVGLKEKLRWLLNAAVIARHSLVAWTNALFLACATDEDSDQIERICDVAYRFGGPDLGDNVSDLVRSIRSVSDNQISPVQTHSLEKHLFALIEAASTRAPREDPRITMRIRQPESGQVLSVELPNADAPHE